MNKKELDLIKKYGKGFDLPMIKCAECKKKLEIRMTTELSPEEERKNKKPKVLLVMGVCHKKNLYA